MDSAGPDHIALKIDVDTYDGMADGVPRLLAALARHGLRASFFLSFGPDRSGLAAVQALRSPRFLLKMLATNAPSLYGWRTMLSGTLLPARPIATSFPALVRRIEDAGHEVAIHAWDHRAWQDGLAGFKANRIRAHFDRALAAYHQLLGHQPAGIGAPAWMTTPLSLRLQDGYGFAYASDLRGGPACRLEVAGTTLRVPQLPASGSCLEELLGHGDGSDQALAERVLRSARAPGRPLTVLTLHAEVEGGPFAGMLEHLLASLDPRRVLPLREAAAGLAHPLPLRAWCMRRIPGRAFPVSSSTPLRRFACSTSC